MQSFERYSASLSDRENDYLSKEKIQELLLSFQVKNNEIIEK